uniref:TIR domain-containing protein n=1 Tax=Magnetococcus massalia (strain MO-1) TaxID=451514 RepID=A0A1S7LEG3_MAGMO|nr:protein of unknown function [Candidatus Magnetococcus massalia]
MFAKIITTVLNTTLKKSAIMNTAFISYSHKDEDFKDNLEEHLTSLKRKGTLKTWHDRKITAGTKWSEEIDSNLESSNIFICLPESVSSF